MPYWEAPQIYSLGLNPALQKQFIQQSTDKEIETFLQLLTSRERKKQEDAVRAIEKKYLSCIFQSNNFIKLFKESYLWQI